MRVKRRKIVQKEEKSGRIQFRVTIIRLDDNDVDALDEEVVAGAIRRGIVDREDIIEISEVSIIRIGKRRG